MTVSVIILTKNRAQLLSQCLSSLESQSVQPDEVIIIDNNSKDRSALVINKFKNKLPILHQIRTDDNIPILYNAGIKLAGSEIIACLDDDCKVNSNWVKNIVQAHIKNPNCVIQGKVVSYPMENIYVKVMANHYKNWLRSYLTDDNSLSVLDTKNVSFPEKIIKNNMFLETLNKGSHDIELGNRLFGKHIRIMLDKDIVVWHKERTTLKEFITQHWRIAQSEAVLKRNTKISNIKIVFSKKNLWSLIDMIKMVAKEISSLRIHIGIYVLFLYFVLLVIRVFGFVYTQIKFYTNPR